MTDNSGLDIGFYKVSEKWRVILGASVYVSLGGENDLKRW